MGGGFAGRQRLITDFMEKETVMIQLDGKGNEHQGTPVARNDTIEQQKMEILIRREKRLKRNRKAKSHKAKTNGDKRPQTRGQGQTKIKQRRKVLNKRPK